MRQSHRATPLRLGILLASLQAGCGDTDSQGSATGRSVLIITLDTARRDYMGFHGRTPSPTPRLDRLAAQSVIFEDAYTVTPLTLPAHSSIMTGLYPVSHTVRDNSIFRLPPGAETLAETLAARGYATSACVAAFVLDPDYGIGQGFERYSAPPRSPGRSAAFMAERPADSMVDLALAELDELEPPFFLWLHLFDPHFPYAPPSPPPATPGATDQEREQQLYAAEIRFADAQIGRLLDALQQRGLDRDLVVAFASDHGESLGDGRESTHGHYIFDPTMRIPLLIHAPGIQPRTVQESVSLVDLFPTILNLVGYPVAAANCDGIDLTPSMKGEVGALADRTVALESYMVYLSYGWAPFEGVVRGKTKYIHSKQQELYDRELDPKEEHNLIEQRAAEAAELAALLEERFARPDIVLPAATRRGMSEDEQRLQAMGYVGEAEVLDASRPDFSTLEDATEKRDLLRKMDESGTAVVEQRYDDALAILRELCEGDPQSSLFHERLGTALLTYRPDQLDEAEHHLKTAVELQPMRSKSHYNLGLIAKMRAADAGQRASQLRQQGKLEDARSARGDQQRFLDLAQVEFRRTLAYESSYPEAMVNLAILLHEESNKTRRRGDPAATRELLEESCQLLRKFLQVIPAAHPDAEQFSRMLELLSEKLEETG